MLPQNIGLIFGAYDLNDLTQSGTYHASPSEIRIHDDWNINTLKYDADIAVLKTEDDVPYSRFIRPVCLWNKLTDPNLPKGVIAGWGKSNDSENYYQSIPKQLRVPIKTQEDCFLDNPSITEMASNRTFCAGSKDGSGPCLGRILY